LVPVLPTGKGPSSSHWNLRFRRATLQRISLGRRTGLPIGGIMNLTMRAAGMFLLLIGVTGVSFAASLATPEIDAASAAQAIALVCGSALIFRAKRSK